MPFVKKSGTKHLQRPTNTRKIFVGRTNEMHFFVENILKPEEPSHNIISVSGQGGVGKSTLLAQFMGIALSSDFKDYCKVALVDERQVTPANIMEKFANQLHLTGEFTKALDRYKEALRRFQSERETGRDTFLRKAPDLAGSVVEDLPLMGSLLKEGAKAAAEFFVNEHYTHQLIRDSQRLQNPIVDLTKAFIEELNRLTDVIIPSFKQGQRRQRIILFFDTFEQLGIEAAPWLLDYFLLTDISNQVVLVVAGRDPIERSTPKDPKRWLSYLDNGTIFSMFLDSFTEEETSTYLTTRGITGTKSISTFWQLSQGLPLYLGLLTSNARGTVDPTKDVVVNFLRWIPEQEQLKLRLALDASLLSKPFNRDDLDAFSYLPENERPTFYQWLVELPFVRTSPQDGRHSYHDLAESLFSRHLFQRSPKEYYATRRALADYYQVLLDKTQPERNEIVYRTALQGRSVFYSAEWVELVMALAYQLFLLPEDSSQHRAAEQILYAYEHTEHTEEIIRILRKLSRIQSDNQINSGVQQTAKQLLRYIEADLQKEKLLATADALLKVFAKKASFSPEVLAHIYRKRGFAYRCLNKLEQAIGDYDRALELNPNYARAYASRGSAYRMLGGYDRAIQDYNRALELNPNYAWAYLGRGETYRLQQEYSKALEDLNRALELEANYARAYARRGFVHLWQGNTHLANADYVRSWELNPAFVHPRWMSEWSEMCQSGISIEMVERLKRIIKMNEGHYTAYVCLGVLLWRSKNYIQALIELERALLLEPEGWDVHFWMGMVYFSLKQNESAISKIEKSLELGLPSVLLAPLHWFEQEQTNFYKEYIMPLMSHYDDSQPEEH